MARQKSYIIKIYDQDGSTLLKTLTTDRPEGNGAYVANVPLFVSRINGGQGECMLDIKAAFDDFDEGVSVNFMNVTKIYAVTLDDSTSPPTQAQTLIYTGIMTRYEPYMEDGAEGVRVTLLGLGSLLTASYYKNGSDFAVTHTSADPETIGRAILDHFNTIFGGSLLSYSNDTTDAVGTTVSITFTDQRWSESLIKTGELAGTNWWWKVDESGLYWLKAKPSTPTHSFTLGREIVWIQATKDSEKVVNDVQVRRSGGTATDYSDATSQQTYGTGSPASGKRTKIVSDSALTDSSAADQRGNKEIADNKDAKVNSPFTVTSKYYAIETIKPGDTCKVRNFDGSSSFFGSNNLMIVAVHYEGDTCKVELEQPGVSVGGELQSLISSSQSFSAATEGSGGGAPTDAQYLTLSANGSLSQERVLTPGAGLSGTDAGAGSTYTLGMAALTFRTVTTTGTLADSDDVVLLDASGGAFTFSLHAVASARRKRYVLKKVDSSSNLITIDGNASEQMDGLLTQGLIVQYATVTIVPDGTSWHILGS